MLQEPMILPNWIVVFRSPYNMRDKIKDEESIYSPWEFQLKMFLDCFKHELVFGPREAASPSRIEEVCAFCLGSHPSLSPSFHLTS